MVSVNASDEATKDNQRVAHLMRIAAVDVAVGARRKMTGPGHRSAGAEGLAVVRVGQPAHCNSRQSVNSDANEIAKQETR